MIQETINVYIVDDHKMVIEGLELLLKDEASLSVIGHALSGDEALKTIEPLAPDVVLLDINMPGLNGIETCKTLIKQMPDLKIIAISMHKESSLIKLMLSNGAKGYVLKNAGKQELIDAIHTVYKGGMYLDETVNTIVVQSVANSSRQKETSPFPTLSKREKEILNLILEEHTTQEIADMLHISFGTVETHRRNMLMKTGARNTAGLVRVALEYKLV